ncbi:hypothetical protein VFPFJ_03519 [Purpureocillium lilacinum]|uniref:Uncharacterized protein n=1 Tax=Purpureocillium lilacinum TaxID=33203 RepID=A0A179HQN9_PURLI|nr:hypothetical protein VFPFJ_03519 [Purpureocillium lilacinum]OAQ91779.1 hypothetical protein VFPFJ_03519 [Purpureocillium lilacinum]
MDYKVHFLCSGRRTYPAIRLADQGKGGGEGGHPARAAAPHPRRQDRRQDGGRVQPLGRRHAASGARAPRRTLLGSEQTNQQPNKQPNERTNDARRDQSESGIIRALRQKTRERDACDIGSMRWTRARPRESHGW